MAKSIKKATTKHKSPKPKTQPKARILMPQDDNYSTYIEGDNCERFEYSNIPGVLAFTVYFRDGINKTFGVPFTVVEPLK